MFFPLSKVIFFAITPSNLLIFATVLGALIAVTRFRRTGAALAVLGGGGLVVAGLSPLCYLVVLPLEQRFPAFVDDGRPIAGIIALGKRPFPDRDSRAMDEGLIGLWNARVRPDDDVWHLGDFAFGAKGARLRAIFERLNGNKRLVRGNHDSHAGDPPASLAIEMVDEPLGIGPFAACHHPQHLSGALVLEDISEHRRREAELREAGLLRGSEVYLAPSRAAADRHRAGAAAGLARACRRAAAAGAGWGRQRGRCQPPARRLPGAGAGEPVLRRAGRAGRCPPCCAGHGPDRHRRGSGWTRAGQ